MVEPSDPNLLEDEAARYLNVSSRTLQKWRQIGGGPKFIKLGGGRLVRYRRSALDEFLASGERNNTSVAKARGVA